MALLDMPRAPGPAGEDDRRDERSGVGRSIAIATVALVLAVLLDAEALEDTARAQPFGWRRDLATGVMEPVLDLSRALHLTAPRRWLEDAFDRPHTRPDPPPSSADSTTTLPPASSSTTGPQSTSTTPTTMPSRRTPTAADPLRLLIAGDSMTESTGPALLDEADATGVVGAAHELRYSSGLTRPDYFDWPRTLTGLMAEQDPEAIVLMIGANDAQGIQTPSGPATFGTEGWTAEYRSRVAATMSLLEAADRTVYWIGLPIMRSGDFDARMRLITEIYRTEAERHRGIRFIDTRALFADATGSYSAYLPGANGDPVLVRRDDGIHLTPTGAERLAKVIMDAIGEDWDIRQDGP